jgi:hypothetical protein
MNRSQVLDAAKQAITKDRDATHGNMEDNFDTIAKYWSIHLDIPITKDDVAVMMALLKAARIKSNPSHADNWVDGVGYFACGGEIATSIG